MKLSKILALLLAIAMLVSVLPLAVSCGDDEKPDDSKDNNQKEEEKQDPEDYTKVPGYSVGGMYGWNLEPVEGVDFGGEVFRVLVPQSSGWIVSRDFATEYSEAGADVIQDAAYERVLAVNKLYNTDIKAVTAKGAVHIEAGTDIESQLGTYDLILCGVTDIGSLSLNHLLADLTAFDGEEIHLKAPWYNQNFVKNMTIGGRLFYVIGDFSIIDNEGITTLQFNMDLIDEYGLDDPYAMVFDGTWTVDALHELCKGRVNDFDGSGTIDRYDEYGFVMNFVEINSFMQGGGCFFAQKDEDDLPYLTLDTPRTYAMLDAMLALQTDTTTSGNFNNFGDDPQTPDMYEYCNKMFMEDRILVRQVAMYRVTQTTNMKSDFGFLPCPKFDLAQQNYYHIYSSGSPAVAIPSYVERGTLDDHAAILEALSYYGRSMLLYAYYDVVMKGRIARDENSRKVLDIIFDASYFDIGACNDFGGMSKVFMDSARNGINTFASDYAAIKGAAEAKIADYIESWASYV